MEPNVSSYLVRGGLAIIGVGVVLAVLMTLLSPGSRFAVSRAGDALSPIGLPPDAGDGLKTGRQDAPLDAAADRRAATREAVAQQTARVRDLERSLVKLSAGPEQEQKQRELIVELNALASLLTGELHAREIELVELKSEMARAAAAQAADDRGNLAVARAGASPGAARSEGGTDSVWFERAGQLGSFFGGISGMQAAWMIFAGSGLTGMGYLVQFSAWLRRKRNPNTAPADAASAPA
jgi:hypothetical protein